MVFYVLIKDNTIAADIPTWTNSSEDLIKDKIKKISDDIINDIKLPFLRKSSPDTLYPTVAYLLRTIVEYAHESQKQQKTTYVAAAYSWRNKNLFTGVWVAGMGLTTYLAPHTAKYTLAGTAFGGCYAAYCTWKIYQMYKKTKEANVLLRNTASVIKKLKVIEEKEHDELKT